MLQNQVIYRKTCTLRIGRDKLEIMKWTTEIIHHRERTESNTMNRTMCGLKLHSIFTVEKDHVKIQRI